MIRQSRFFYRWLLLDHIGADNVVVVVSEAVFKPEEFNLLLILITGAWQFATLISDHSLWDTMIWVQFLQEFSNLLVVILIHIRRLFLSNSFISVRFSS